MNETGVGGNEGLRRAQNTHGLAYRARSNQVNDGKWTRGFEDISKGLLFFSADEGNADAVVMESFDRLSELLGSEHFGFETGAGLNGNDRPA
jgi:hypothetical protein